MNLPDPIVLPDALGTCLDLRRSQRPDRRHRAPDLRQIGTLLHHAARGPSAGGLHVIQLYAAGPPEGLLRYSPAEHILEVGDADPSLLLEWMGQAMGNTTPPPYAILLAQKGGPAEQKYGRAARRLVQMDAGAI